MKIFWGFIATLCFVGMVALAFFYENGDLDNGNDYWSVFWLLVVGGFVSLLMYAGEAGHTFVFDDDEDERPTTNYGELEDLVRDVAVYEAALQRLGSMSLVSPDVPGGVVDESNPMHREIVARVELARAAFPMDRWKEI